LALASQISRPNSPKARQKLGARTVRRARPPRGKPQCVPADGRYRRKASERRSTPPQIAGDLPGRASAA
jgi:hypothetical protein